MLFIAIVLKLKLCNIQRYCTFGHNMCSWQYRIVSLLSLTHASSKVQGAGLLRANYAVKHSTSTETHHSTLWVRQFLDTHAAYVTVRLLEIPRHKSQNFICTRTSLKQ